MLFLHQALTWGFLLALVPLLIHLINMMRHQRVQWAAMEFLLQSYRKHRQWVWLKQLLLLLARMAAVALIVALLAHLITQDRWLKFFGGQTTHHYVVLDDSYSMSERTSGASAFDVARQAITRLVNVAENSDSPQRFTLIRYSKAARSANESSGQAGVTQAADFNSAIAADGLEVKLQERFRTMQPSELAVGPDPALALVSQMIADSPDEVSQVHVVSDFRQPDWEAATETKEQLRRLQELKSEIHFLQCARATEPNLGIVEIAPANDTRAAGVPLFVNVKVKNHGVSSASRVQIKIRTIEYPADEIVPAAIEHLQGVSEDVVTLLIDELGPGETAVRRAQVYFPKPGKHVVEALLPEDSIAADNRRWCVVDFPAGERVLVVDGSVEQQHAYYLQAAMQPLQRSVTGLRPETQPASFLRDVDPLVLRSYSAVYLLDVPRLDERAVDTLEDYVRSGGGLAVFLGPQAQTDFYNQRMYKDGEGLMPYAIGFEYELPPVLDEGTPDLELSNHPIFSFFTSQTNPLINGIVVNRYRRPKDDWKEQPAEGEQTAEVIARLRDRAPLMLERHFGAGRVVCMTTTLAPDWNDWAKNPSFVVLLLKLQGYLASPQRLDDPRLVGTPLEVSVDADQFQDEVQFVAPGPQRVERILITETLQPASGTSRALAEIGEGAAGKDTGATDRSGVYEAWPVSTLGEVALQRWALNVAPTEGEVKTIDSRELLQQLEPVAVQFHRAEDYQQEVASAGGFDLSPWLLLVLVLLLIGEQALAYSASYHIISGGSR